MGDAEDDIQPSQLALPRDAAIINAIDAAKVQGYCRSELAGDESWCLLYCGAVQQIRSILVDSAKKSKFHYAEETFNW